METPEPSAAGNSDNQLSGHVRDVVQARDINGGIHFYGASSPSGSLPQQLPGEARGFVNRTSELRTITDAAQPTTSGDGCVRVIVIAGTAGVGKTSIALRWAHQNRGDFPDGQLFVNLRGYDPGHPVTASDALSRFLLALGIPAKQIPDDGHARSELFRSMVAGRRILIVLDNAATATQVRPLLPGTTHSLVLVTSRSRLSGIVAREGARRINIGVLRESESVVLLRKTLEGYRVGDGELDMIELANLCANLPLALRIAAERAASRPLMSLSELVSDLRDESGLWDALSNEDDDEAQSVRSVFAWSYRALPEAAAQLFRRLGIHPSGEFGPHAAAALISSNLPTAKRLIDTLVGSHLVQESGLNRFQMHDLLRTYAADQMRIDEPTGAQQEVSERLFTWYLHAFHASGKNSFRYLPPVELHPLESPLELPKFDSDTEASIWYKNERANLILIAQKAADIGLESVAWQIPATQAEIHIATDPIGTWRGPERNGLAIVRRQQNFSGMGTLLLCCAISDRLSGRFRTALDEYSEASQVFRLLGDMSSEARAENGCGITARRLRELPRSVDHFTRAMSLTEQAGEHSISAAILLNLGTTLRELNEFERAEASLRQSLEMDSAAGAAFYRTETLEVLASVYRLTGRADQAQCTILEALNTVPSTQLQLNAARNELARIQLFLLRPEDALATSRESAAASRLLANIDKEADSWGIAGSAYFAMNRFEEAADFHRQAASAHRSIGEHWSLAQDLDNLADALDAAGDGDRARTVRLEAVNQLSQFSDASAAMKRVSIERKLHQRPH
ncbi:ATP-binding protein [Nocardia asteroides]|uniref:ATP-binding protein n=1 Tax=Nocardia asteroides TaxID=1824 RepID=UPI0037AFBD57